jgi:D-beta-D-heptose 7-phosphate kinase/D-beta-D-heptose 1-phosphate adenosyltransferase
VTNLSLAGAIDVFRDLRVAVIGDAMLDTYLTGTTHRLCPEAPVPVVALSGRSHAAGGAGNTAVNLCRLGAAVALFSVTGDDVPGRILAGVLSEAGVPVDHILRHPSRATLVKQRVLAASQMLLRIDEGSTGVLDGTGEVALLDRLRSGLDAWDAVVVSDYGYGVLTPGVLRLLRDRQARAPRLLLVDAKDLGAYRAVGATAVKPNYTQACRLLKESPGDPNGDRAAWVQARGDRVLDRTGARIAAVTLDSDGALVLERDRPPYRTYSRPAQHAQPAGAGDTFLSAFTLALAAGCTAPAAAELASAAAAIVVERGGTASCSAQELRAYLGARLAASGKHVADRERLAALIRAYRREGRQIVFTNGCFDILHRGHVTYLSRAKSLGDVLIVGLNSDESIRRLKGPGRPITAAEDRIQVLAALSCIDHIAVFDDDTPCDLLRIIRPDVYVKGGDYARAMLREAPLVEALGGTVRILPYVEDCSTTGIIQRIRSGAAGATHQSGRGAAEMPRP